MNKIVNLAYFIAQTKRSLMGDLTGLQDSVITHARTNNDSVYVERFGNRYLTVFNDSPQRQQVLVSTDFDLPGTCKDLVSAQSLDTSNNTLSLTLHAETVAVIDLQ